MKNVTIDISYDCPHCDNGVIANPEWLEWSDKIDELRKAGKITPGMTVVEEDEVLKQHSIFTPHGSEEYECPDCDGTQRLTKQITLDELSALQKAKGN